MWRVRGLSRISLSYNVLPLFSADASIYVSFSPSYILGISKRTLQEYRAKGLLPFGRIKNKLFYKPEDVEKVLQSYYHANSKKL